MDDVNDILNDLGISSTSPSSNEQAGTPVSAQESHTEDSQSSFSNEDIDDIISDNGIQDAVFEGEGHEEEVENESYDENQGEGGDLDVEQRLYEEAVENADPDVNDTDEEEETPDTDNAVEEDPSTQQEVTGGQEIPLNSPTLLIDESTSRFSGAEWFSEIQKKRILVGGCGGIGSNLVFQLARMVPANITIYDDDIVEMANMAGQLYSYDDVGMAKVTAIHNMISKYTSMYQVNAVKEKFTPSTETGDIMMCGFDNMRARKMFFNSWYDHIKDKSEEEKAKCLYLDGRLSMDTLQILCIRGDDAYNINRYQCEFLFSDFEADETICSMKQTTYLACMIGSLMVNLFTNFVAGTLDPIIPYDLPFFTEYDAQSMIFKTEN